MENKIKVVVMGLGYIGLPTAALMASKGLQVQGVDISPNVINTLREGKIHIVEPSLDGLVKHVIDEGSFTVHENPSPADVFVLAVPTPFNDSHKPNISFVENATQMIIPHLREGNLFILESTSPVGTTDALIDLVHKNRPELEGKVFFAYCPERVLPGNIIYELENNDRVIGGKDNDSTEKAKKFYSHFVKGQFFGTNSRTAEMCKLVENSYRDVNIAFANELSMICDKAGINTYELIELTNRHPRVKILQPGPGVGGHCIAVDPWFIISEFPNEARMIRQAREVNHNKTDFVSEKIKKAALEFKQKNNKKPLVALLGLSYKPNVDDLRESPSIDIWQKLSLEDFNVVAVEPHVKEYKDIKLVELEEALNADIIVFLVAHDKFKSIMLRPSKIVLDFSGVTRNKI